MLACKARLDNRMPPGELAQISFAIASVWSSRSSGPVNRLSEQPRSLHCEMALRLHVRRPPTA